MSDSDKVSPNCPQCGELLVFPRGDDAYCEDCGWPDEDFDDVEVVKKYIDGAVIGLPYKCEECNADMHMFGDEEDVGKHKNYYCPECGFIPRDKEYMPDMRYYCIKTAKQQVKLFGWFLYYTGAMQLYLDCQVWKARFRIWHPFTWLYLFANIPFVLWFGMQATVPELMGQLRIDKKYKPWTYWKARKHELRERKVRKKSAEQS